MKILIVEDEITLANTLKSLLEKKGFEVELCYDGESGTDYALLGIYDLLILDVMMPELDGFSVLDYLNDNNYLNKLPVIIISGNYDMDKLVDALTSIKNSFDKLMIESAPFFTAHLTPVFKAAGIELQAKINEVLCKNTFVD